MKLVEHGRGKPLLMIHGLGGSTRSWDTVADALAAERRLLLFDIPGHGEAPAEPDSGTFTGLCRSVSELIVDNGLRGVDMIGSSMGARMVLELARRGLAGNVVSLDPGGFWVGWERAYLRNTLSASVWLLRSVRPALSGLAHNAVSRSALLAQLSARPWALDGDVVARELQSFASCRTFDALVEDLAAGPAQQGPSAPGSGRVTIVWGKQDRLCLPQQAERAKAAFPEAELVWFDRCGHFPMWDQPEDTVELVLRATA
ncbi:alpha/beta fold hydrolase [Sphingomonas sp. GCM10030256]|uniref:alpha/beta fold hydrolase n=1 Tax=Sphingomonas sp. GCM10030256 TaxID=3273427 RepID=UPI0036195715